MADLKISALTAATSVDGSEAIPFAKSGSNGRMTPLQLAYAMALPPVPKVGFVGDSIMTRFSLIQWESPLFQSMIDVPRLWTFDPNDAGAVAVSGSDSSNTNTPQPNLTGSTNIANHNSYNADIEFGLVGGNNAGGTDATLINDIRTYMAARWAVKPGVRFVWHVPTPQSSRTSVRLIQLRNYLRALEKADPRVRIMDMSSFMLDTQTSNAPVGGTGGGAGAVSSADGFGQHPSGWFAYQARDRYTRLLDEMGVRRLDIPLTSATDLYNASSMPGGNLLTHGNNTTLGKFDGAAAPFGSPAKWTGTIATAWDPQTPAQFTIVGTGNSSFSYKGRSINALKMQINSTAVTLSGADQGGISRSNMTWASGGSGQVTGRFALLAYLENVVGLASFVVQIKGYKNSVFTTYTYGAAQAYGASDVVPSQTRVLEICLPNDFAFDAGSQFEIYIKALFASGTTPAGNIYLASAQMQPVLALP